MKKTGKKTGGKTAAAQHKAPVSSSVQDVVADYQRLCRSRGVTINHHLLQCLKPSKPGDESNICQLIIETPGEELTQDDFEILGLCMLGKASPSGLSYRHLRSLCIWGVPLSEGAVAGLSSWLTDGGLLPLTILELMNVGLTPEGCAHLGNALSKEGANKSFAILKLGTNPTMGDKGIEQLCRGLRMNSSVQELHLPYCNIGEEGALYIAQMLSFKTLKLSVLNLTGNRIRGRGLKFLCRGLRLNQSLTDINISDNAICEDVPAIEALSAVLAMNTRISCMNIMFNNIGDECARVLMKSVNSENTTLKTFLVDITLSDDVFKALFRREAKKPLKKKGKKKGKARNQKK